MCSSATHRHLCGLISRAAAARALSVDYRLAPEHPFPAALDDALAAWRWLLGQGIPPARIVVTGDSAGGGLAAATLLALRDQGTVLPSAAVLISPWTDLALTGQSLTSRAALDPMTRGIAGLEESASAYLAGADPRTPLASPLYADLRGLPPLLIQVGTNEVLFDDAVRFDARARTAGVEVTLQVWDGMMHVWHMFAPRLPEGQQAIDNMAAFIKARTATSVPA